MNFVLKEDDSGARVDAKWGQYFEGDGDAVTVAANVGLPLTDAGFAKLDLILCEQHTRTLTKNLALSFEGRTYQVTGHGKGYRLRGARVTVCRTFDGAVTVLRDGRELPARLLAQGETGRFT